MAGDEDFSINFADLIVNQHLALIQVYCHIIINATIVGVVDNFDVVFAFAEEQRIGGDGIGVVISIEPVVGDRVIVHPRCFTVNFVDDECQRVVSGTGGGDVKGEVCRIGQFEVVEVIVITITDPVTDADGHVGTGIFDTLIDLAVFDENVVFAIVGLGEECGAFFKFNAVVDCGIGFCFNIIGVRVEHQIIEATFVFVIFVIIFGRRRAGNVDEFVIVVECVKGEVRIAGSFKFHVEFGSAVDGKLQIVNRVIRAEIAVLENLFVLTFFVNIVFIDNTDRFIDQTVGTVFFAVGPVVFGSVEVGDVDCEFTIVVFGEVVEFAVVFVSGVGEGEVERIISAENEETAIEVAGLFSQQIFSEGLIFGNLDLESSISGNRAPVVDQRAVGNFAG